MTLLSLQARQLQVHLCEELASLIATLKKGRQAAIEIATRAQEDFVVLYMAKVRVVSLVDDLTAELGATKLKLSGVEVQLAQLKLELVDAKVAEVVTKEKL